MGLIDVLNKNIINLQLNGKTKDEVLHELSDDLLTAGYISDRKQFVEDIYVRESEGITGMGNHIAIPHGKSSSVKKIGVAIGKCKQNIEWESYDDEPVNLIFLFCVSDDDNFAKNHMELLADLAGKLGDDNRVLKLQEAKNADEIIEILAN